MPLISGHGWRQSLSRLPLTSFAVAVQDIERSEELFTVSLTSAFTSNNSSLNQVARTPIKSLESSGEQMDALILAMIYEESKGKDSTWRPYLDVLPNAFDTLMYWSPSELEELQGSAVKDKIGLESASQHFRDILWPQVISNSSIYGPDISAGSQAESQLQSSAHRMASLVLSYGFDLDPHVVSEKEMESEDEEEEPQKGMVPLADLCNADGDYNNASRIG